MTPPDFQHVHQGRNRATLLVLVATWLALALAIAMIGLAPWIAATLAVFTLPALWDLAANPRSSLTLTRDSLAWRGLRHGGDLPLAQLARVRFDTRLDLSVRVTLHLADGRRIRLPQACAPPHRAFESALQARGIATERHHFSLLG